MSKGLLLIDTSVLCEFLCVPGKYDPHSGILEKFKEYNQINATTFATDGKVAYEFYLPIATIIETGNHIGQIDDGQVRRERAGLFVDFVRNALTGETPFKLLDWEIKEMSEWIGEFPDFTMRQLGGLGDLSIIKEYERLCSQPPSARPVKIWSKDAHLASYSRNWEGLA